MNRLTNGSDNVNSLFTKIALIENKMGQLRENLIKAKLTHVRSPNGVRLELPRLGGTMRKPPLPHSWLTVGVIFHPVENIGRIVFPLSRFFP